MDKRVRWHYAWLVVLLTFGTLLVAAGVRSAPSVFIKPFEREFGWHRDAVSLAVAVSLLAYGLGGPLGGSLVDRWGPRRVMLGGLGLTVLGLLPLRSITALWQLHLLWGVIIGVGTGAIATVLGATVAHRWFHAHRGMVIGLFGAASAAGQLLFLPWLVALNARQGWREALMLLIIACAALLLPVALLMRDRPADLNLRPVGAMDVMVEQVTTNEGDATPLRQALRTRDFWLLAGSFFVCGYTTNGLIGTHLLPHAVEHGFTDAATASALGLMGAMNIIGTLASGWLSDRWDNRKLLATYYGFRALSLLALPWIGELRGLLVWAVVYGLDWVATVPPTVNLTAKRFGRASLGTLFGWIFCSHMVGAAVAAYAGGYFRERLGDYRLVFMSAAIMGFIAVMLVLRISVVPRRVIRIDPQPTGAA